MHVSALVAALISATALQSVHAADKEAWRSRSIYQLITDRFAPPSGSAPARTEPLPAECDPKAQTWCGGTWLSIIDKLDYIQSMGFDAVWISPVSQNIDVPTPYNFAYHGYWVNDPTQLNPRFGSADDLKALSDALHKRDMYLMVDIVVNNIPSLSVNASTNADELTADKSFWTKPEYFHPQCWIDYNNNTSVEYCWLGDDKLPLMDVNTENEFVISTLQSWISNLVKTYNIDGLRIDAAKHIPDSFWPGFCQASGVFCIGEVYGDDLGFAAHYQTNNVMDSVLGFPMYFAVMDTFSIEPMRNTTKFISVLNNVTQSFTDTGVLGNFLENHDLPRFRNVTADPRLSHNAIVFQFLFDGIPVVYYGQEQEFTFGGSDPYNRQALWPSEYQNTTSSQYMTRLNQIRSHLIKNNVQFNGQTFLQSKAKVIASTMYDVAIRKGPVVMSITTRGSPEQTASFGIDSTGWDRGQSVIDMLSCREFTTGSGGSLSVSYSQQGYGGMPYVWVTKDDAKAMGICTNDQLGITTPSNSTSSTKASGASHGVISTSWIAGLSLALVAGLSQLA